MGNAANRLVVVLALLAGCTYYELPPEEQLITSPKKPLQDEAVGMALWEVGLPLDTWVPILWLEGAGCLNGHVLPETKGPGCVTGRRRSTSGQVIIACPPGCKVTDPEVAETIAHEVLHILLPEDAEHVDRRWALDGPVFRAKKRIMAMGANR